MGISLSIGFLCVRRLSSGGRDNERHHSGYTVPVVQYNQKESREDMTSVFQDKLMIGLAMTLYMSVIIGIGLYYAKRSHSSTDEYFLGGRSLGPYVTALSAGASDMSGWLLMGLPGLAYWIGIGDAFWTAVGLAVGTYLNWLIIARRLRVYSHIADNAVTIPDFFSNRFMEKEEDRKSILAIASLFILIFFIIYAASCFVTVGKLFSALFGLNYVWMMIAGALFVFIYTYLGGFLAESTSDFLQGIVMILALVTVLITGTVAAGGVGAVIENAQNIPGFLDFFGKATPQLDASGQQIMENGLPGFGSREDLGWVTIISNLAWGLGYFGVPQVLLRFMAIRDADEIKVARRVGTVWAVVSLFAAIVIGMIGRVLLPNQFTSLTAAENIFPLLAQSLMPAFVAGIVMAGILAATISSADSYLLIAASAVSKNIYKGIFRKKATDRQVMAVTRITLIVTTILGILFALDENSVIFNIVSFAWAGFGATFGPALLFSLFSKRVTRQGILAGMVTGGLTVLIWNLMLSQFGGIFSIYELLPAFILSCLAIILISSKTQTSQAVREQHIRYITELEKEN